MSLQIYQRIFSDYLQPIQKLVIEICVKPYKKQDEKMTNRMIYKSLLFPPIKIPSLFRPLLIFPFQFIMTCTVRFISHTFLILKTFELLITAGEDSFGYSPASIPLPNY